MAVEAAGGIGQISVVGGPFYVKSEFEKYHMSQQEMLEQFRDSSHEETRIAFLFLSLLRDRVHPETRVTFVGPGDYTEVAGWGLAIEVVHDGKSAGKPVVNVVERPERSRGIPQSVNECLKADYCVEMQKVSDFFERTQTGLVILRNPPYITNTQKYQKAFVGMMSWAQEHGAGMLLTLRRGETDNELEQTLFGFARRLETPMTADHLGDDEVIFLCE